MREHESLKATLSQIKGSTDSLRYERDDLEQVKVKLIQDNSLLRRELEQLQAKAQEDSDGSNGEHQALPVAASAAGQEELKCLGDAAFRTKEFERAKQHYCEALKLDQTDSGPLAHILHSNLAATYINLADWPEALHHGTRCTELSPSFAKGHHRVGTAAHMLGMHKTAVEAFETALELDPGNQHGRHNLEHARAHKK